MILEYRITKQDDSILNVMWKDSRILTQINDWKMYFYRPVKQVRTKKDTFVEELFYNKNYIKSICSYVFDDDFVELYKEWREERKLSPSYKTPYNEASEKKIFNKLAWKPKQIALKMLENASGNKWLILYDLDKREEEEIITRLRNEQHKIDVIQKWVVDTSEFNKNQEERQILNDLIDQNPKIREEAKQYVSEHNPNVEWQYRESLIMTRARMIAKRLREEWKI